MSYTREDDRYFRSAIQTVEDRVEELIENLDTLLDELRSDDPVATADARACIVTAKSKLRDARYPLDAALRELPAPVVAKAIAPARLCMVPVAKPQLDSYAGFLR